MTESALNFTVFSNPGTPLESANQELNQKLTNRVSDDLSVEHLERLTNDYLTDCEYRLQSPNTIAIRRVFIRNLIWFLSHRNYPCCGTSELRQFFAYLGHGHKEPGGRWGQARYTKPVRPVTIKDYYVNLRCLFNWLVEDGAIRVSPLEKISKPTARPEQVQPFSQEQIQALIAAAKRSSYSSRRDEAIVLFLYDTGVRASELCGLRMKDIDLVSRHAHVLGKGNKRRVVYFSRETAKVLSHYLRKAERGQDDPVFSSIAGLCGGGPLTRSGLGQMIGKLGQEAGIKGMKVSPHVFRHSAAIQLLRNGCDVFTLMSLLGHTSLTVCQNYLKLSKLDVENQHRRYSPVDSMFRRPHPRTSVAPQNR